MKKALHSIPVRVSLFILLVETVLLAIMGSYYINRFWGEIDKTHHVKMLLPATLMSERALNFEAVMDFKALGRLVNEDVVDAFICKQDGTIYYSSNQKITGKPYQTVLSPEETSQLTGESGQLINFTGKDGTRYTSSFAPLLPYDRPVGYLYIKINADHIAAAKKNIFVLFVIGSLMTIAMTTLLEALFVRQLLSPRIKDICMVLNRVAAGDLTDRVSSIAARDEIDSIGSHLNDMIDTVEQATLNLQQLNEAGELFATAENSSEIYAIICGTITTQLGLVPDASCFVNGVVTSLQSLPTGLEGIDDLDRKRLNDGEIVINPSGKAEEQAVNRASRSKLFFPLQEDEQQRESVLCFYLPSDRISLTTTEKKFLHTLQNMATNALRRLTLRRASEEAENKYQEIFNSALQGIFRCNSDGGLEIANPALAEMTGYGTAQRMLDEFNFRGATLVGDPEQWNKIQEHIKIHGKVKDDEILLTRKDGSCFWAMFTARARYDSSGKIIATEGAIVNIEERKNRQKCEREKQAAEAANRVKSEMLSTLERGNKKLEKTLTELHRTQNSLMQSERMAAIGMTASGVAHDLNNILSGIINYPELLLSKLPDDSELHKPLQGIRASGQRAAAVVDDLLTLTRGTAQNKTPDRLNRLIKDYLGSSEYKYLREHHPEIRVTVQLCQELHPILCAPLYIYKMIMNLVTNSIEAMGESGEAQITTENTSISGNDFATLKIADNGSGISPSDRDHIFEPFYSKKVMGHSGTGLGLTIVQNAVLEHNGSITVDTGDQGTTFTINLPAHHSEQISRNDVEKIPELKGSGTVLVVDDEEVQRDIAEEILKNSGYIVHVAPSGEEAIYYCRKHEVDFILLDMLMPPGINGRQTFEEIKTFRPQQKAMIVSGFSADIEVKEAIKAGCLGFIKKPYTMAQLTKAVHEAMAV